MGMQRIVQISDTDPPERTDEKLLPVEDMLDILRLISRVEPLDILLQRVVDTIAEAFSIRCVSLGVFDEKTGLFVPKAIHGFPPEKAIQIKKHGYTLERMKRDLVDELKIGRSCYYVRMEDQNIAYDDVVDYILNPEAVDKPRESPDDWHELDYIDFVMTDRIGNWIGWIEIDEPTEKKVPSKGAVDRIQILADLAAIAIENSKMYEEAVNAITDSRGYLDLIVHDIGNMAIPLQFYVNSMVTLKSPDERTKALGKNALALTNSMSSLVESVRKFSEAKASETLPKETLSLKDVLEECIASLKRAFPSKEIVVNFDAPANPVQILADRLVFDLFSNLLNNAAKYTVSPLVEIDVKITEGYSANTVRIEDRGKGIPDSKKDQIFARFARRPEGYDGTGLGLSIVSLLVKRYGGIVAVKDRVPGDCSKGACFEVSLPKIMDSEVSTQLRDEERLAATQIMSDDFFSPRKA